MPAATVSVDALRRQLRRMPAASAGDLAAALGISVPTVHRLLARLEPGEALSAGKARRSRHALGRALRGGPMTLPVHRVDMQGRLQAAPPLSLVAPAGSLMDLAGSDWPAPEEARDGWWPGLPYPLHQMRPQGYMGRQFARAEHLRLQVPADVAQWSDDDALFAISQTGSDLSGDWVVGEAATALWLAERARGTDPVAPADQPLHYAAQAAQAVATGVAGSSAAGEFPKFTARRELQGAATPHVIVKFSGAEDSATVRRWADLLVCEHLALSQAASLTGLRAAPSRVLQAQGRTFLEVERFDRHGEAGRSPLVALDVLNAAFVGSAFGDWPTLTGQLAAQGRIDAADRAAVLRLWWFGRLVANTDMHAGNLAFVPEAGHLRLAPAYDMLPMRFAPLAGGEVRTPEPDFALPLPEQRPAWLEACVAALVFWERAAGDSRISEGFREVCRAQRQALLRLRDLV
ncbi:type II toxin-antitoxin system HipA family toxin YjjJ [Xenophilus arseniciresistens]|uniref:Type II toxin-antitoxin system HipA family toxin YjjJ n=1 Tax=Xenophilus arseniciresistens TaxID=1283306 RepID=A0AAE3SZZ5_9BURK|nr:type II toxin-antitoxin system HipA family toxin YjjJ [Xenophilus arseniciresistens]MDA7417619.1 type II toxin-antitoxin system HipA family toxin YjjJ [Xenophilus arseniciresistens]